MKFSHFATVNCHIELKGLTKNVTTGFLRPFRFHKACSGKGLKNDLRYGLWYLTCYIIASLLRSRLCIAVRQLYLKAQKFKTTLSIQLRLLLYAGGFMRCPKCYTETPNNAVRCPGCKFPTPQGKKLLSEKRKKKKAEIDLIKSVKVFKKKKTRRQIKPWLAVVVGIATVLIIGGVSYFITISSFQQSEAKVSPSQAALEKLRNMPSSTPGMTVEQYLDDEMEKSREAGRLLEAEGWSMEPTNGGGEFIISFTYEERDAGQKRAQWRVNPAKNSFRAENELAKAVYDK